MQQIAKRDLLHCPYPPPPRRNPAKCLWGLRTAWGQGGGGELHFGFGRDVALRLPRTGGARVEGRDTQTQTHTHTHTHTQSLTHTHTPTHTHTNTHTHTHTHTQFPLFSDESKLSLSRRLNHAFWEWTPKLLQSIA